MTVEHENAHLLPDAYLAQIGRIAVLSARLEDRLHNLFALLASETPPTASGVRKINVAVSVLLADDSLSQHIDRLRLLAARTMTRDGERFTGAINRLVPDEFAPSLDGLVKRCEAARTARNEMIHAQWSVDPDGQVLRTVRRVRRLRYETKVTPLAELQEAARLVEEAGDATLNLHFDLHSGELHDWGVMPNPADQP